MIVCLIIFLTVSSGCWQPASWEEPVITEIHDPEELPPELQDFEFHLFKRGDFGSRVIVLNLALETIQTYFKDGFISAVDVTPDHDYLVYNQVYRLGGVEGDWIWKVGFRDPTKIKLAGWMRDYTEFLVDAPRVSPDGEKVLFSFHSFKDDMDGLARVDIDGNNLEILDTDMRLVDGPVSSPDGSLILVFCGGSSQEFYDIGLCLLDDKGKFIEFLADDHTFYGEYGFSPNGKKVVYADSGLETLWFLIPNTYRFILLDLETNESILLSIWDVGLLGFSSDSEQIIFIARKNPRDKNKLYIMNIDGSDLRHLAYYDQFLEEWYADMDE